MNQPSPHQLPSNRSFGLLFVGCFAGLSAWGVYRHSPSAQIWGGLSLLALLVTIFIPVALAPFNRLWMHIGLLLSRIVNPIVMGVIFFVLITPIALVMRVAKRDPLRLSFDQLIASYWIERDPPGPNQESFLRQF